MPDNLRRYYWVGCTEENMEELAAQSLSLPSMVGGDENDFAGRRTRWVNVLGVMTKGLPSIRNAFSPASGVLMITVVEDHVPDTVMLDHTQACGARLSGRPA
jgi:hypothetical protein